jgi:predicted nucleic acid-binding protein
MKILGDTSVWVDHLRTDEPNLRLLLAKEEILGHPLLAGELSVGSIRNRAVILRALDRLPQGLVAKHSEVRQFIELHKLFGRGVGFVDAHLLLSVRLTPETLLWTRDKRLHAIAAEMSIAYIEPAALTQ